MIVRADGVTSDTVGVCTVETDVVIGAADCGSGNSKVIITVVLCCLERLIALIISLSELTASSST